MALPASDEVHVWAIDLDRSGSEVDLLAALLAADELRHAASIAGDDARRRFVVARAALRVLLGEYLGVAPDAVAFGAVGGGKPRLDPPSLLRFNVTHSHELALIACAHAREVGVDVESGERELDARAVARRYLVASERAAVAEGADERHELLRHWVAKEAVAKATGRGVARSLRSIEVVLDPPLGPRVVRIGGDTLEAGRWSLAPLDVPEPYVGALVTETGARLLPVAPFDPLREEAR